MKHLRKVSTEKILLNIKEVAAENGVSLYRIEKDLSLIRGSLCGIKKYGDMNVSTLLNIARYLNTTTDRLLIGVEVIEHQKED